MAIIILIVIISMAVMIGIGVYGSRKKAATESMSNFLTAGRNGGLFVLVCTYIGSHVGNGIIVGGAQYGADYGIGGMWYGLGAVLSYVLFGLVMSRLLYRRGYITIPDLIRDRYESKVASVVMAVLNICASLGIMAAQVMAGSSLFAALGLNPTLGAVVVAVVVTFAGTLVAVFNSQHSAQLADYAIPGLRLYFLGFLFAGANIVKSGFYSATGRGRESSILALCRGVVAIVAFAFLLSHLFGITGVWLAFPAAELFTLLLGLVLGRPQGLGAPDPRPA